MSPSPSPPRLPNADGQVYEARVERRPWLEFRNTFDAGHVMQMLTLTVLAIFAFATLQGRQAELERNFARLTAAFEKEQMMSRETTRLLESNIGRQIDKLGDKMDKLREELAKKADR